MTPPPESEVREIHLFPIGALQRTTVDRLAAGVSRRISIPCRVRGGHASPPVLLRDRDQVDADALLSSLDTHVVPGAVVVGVTALDMAIPIFTFVFGRAKGGGQTAVVSLARLDPAFYGLPSAPAVLLSRAEVELVHELGHVGGLAHCRDAQCLMNFAGNVERVDARGSTFCADCARELPPWLAPA
jgi:archaemetzincin